MKAIKRYYRQFRGLFPSPLPQGVTEFDAWVADIKATYTLPTDRDADIVACFSAVIMRFDQIATNKPKYFFVRALRSGAAKQVASHAFTLMKQKQAAAQAAEAAAAAATEATVTDTVANATQK